MNNYSLHFLAVGGRILSKKLCIYIIKRLLLALLTIFIVITVTFFAMNAIPGGPFLAEKSPSPEVIKQLEMKYGLDKPLFERYVSYLGDVFFRFDFGPSIKSRGGKQVLDILLVGFKTSGKLGIIAALSAIVLGIFFGTVASINRNKFIDKLIMVLTTACNALPSFIMGSFLLLTFCVKLRWFPPNGLSKGGLFLPIVTLSLYPMAYITRLTRSSMLDVMGQDFIRTARAKGVSGKKTIFVHALKNALIPVITYAGPMIAYILTGSLVVEKIFAVGGLGRDFVSSIINRDYPVIMGTTIFLSILVVVMTFISDILYKIVDPRIELK